MNFVIVLMTSHALYYASYRTLKGMLANTVIGYSSDNGGPLDHANNAPFRGGKHTFWEGGLRAEAFIWSPLLPPVRRGTEWNGLVCFCFVLFFAAI